MIASTRFLIAGVISLFLFNCKEADLLPTPKETSSAKEKAASNSTSRLGGLTYVPIPNRPALGTSSILTYSHPGNILNNSGGATQDKILSGPWQQFHAFSLTGNAASHKRISVADSTVVIGSIANHLFTWNGTLSNYFELNGTSPAAPMCFENVGGVAATSSVQLTAQASGPNVWMMNHVNNTRGYGLFANTAGTLSGGNATTPASSANNYGTIDFSFIRSFNATDNHEHFYIGATTNNTYAIHHDLHGSHILGYLSEWDGIQVLNATDFTLSNMTFVGSGTDGDAADAQDAHIQIQNAYGIIENSILYDANQALRLATHQLIFRNNYVHWTGNEQEDAIEILDYYFNYAATNRLMVNPAATEILIENCDFVGTNWTGALMKVSDGEVNVVIRNCRIEGPTSLFLDNRGANPTGTLTDGGGNTFVPAGTIPVPTFTNFTPTDYDGHGLLTNAYHHALGRGYRTPAP
jgi:hypothetical protein